MITLVLKDKRIVKLSSLDDMKPEYADFISMQIADSDEAQVHRLEQMFGIDCSIMEYTEDIEISSHFVEDSHQVSFHYSIPYFVDRSELIEEDAFMILTRDHLFYFMTSKLDAYFQNLYAPKIESDLEKIVDVKVMFKLITEFVSDYFADITESMSKQILNLAKKIFRGKEVVESDLDTITDINFNNILVKESINEAHRLFLLFKKSEWCYFYDAKDFIDDEIQDIKVVSEYIQSNFDRLDDLKENVNSKIDLEQNNIVKILTMVTLCIALPTLIAGIYGMNFRYMPELTKPYGYPIALIAMALSVLLPLAYFKRKKWL